MLYLGAKKSLLSSGKTLAAQIAALFASGEQGAWYDPSDLSTLFQDSAGTTPVTAVGQPVGLMLDKSGRGNAARQPTAINRPVLQIDGNGKYYLATNGTNQWMYLPEIYLPNNFFYAFGVGQNSDAIYQGLFEMIRTGGAIGTAADSILQDYSSEVTASTAARNIVQRHPSTVVILSAPRYPVAPARRVSWASLKANADSGDLFAGSAVTSVSSGAKSITPALGVIHLMRGYQGTFTNGSFYGAIIRMALTPAASAAPAIAYLQAKTGVTL